MSRRHSRRRDPREPDPLTPLNLPLLQGETERGFLRRLDTYLGNLEQSDSKEIYLAKALRRKVTLGVISTEGRNLSQIPRIRSE